MSKVASFKSKRLSLASLKPHPKNPRNHPDKGSERWESMRRSLNSDYFDPLIYNVRNGMMVSGHFRLKVLIDDGFTEADVIEVDYDEPTHLARMLAANKSAGSDNADAMKTIFEELAAFSFEDISGLTGFDAVEFEKFMPEEPDFTFPEGATETPSAQTSASTHAAETPPPSIKYLQLIYSFSEYEEFSGLVESYRREFGESLKQDFSEETALTLPSVLLHVLRSRMQ